MPRKTSTRSATRSNGTGSNVATGPVKDSNTRAAKDSNGCDAVPIPEGVNETPVDYMTRIMRDSNGCGAVPIPEGVNETPVDYMTRIMRDTTCDPKRRDTMALKLASIIYKQKDDKPAGEPLKVAVRKFSEPST